MVSRAVRNSQAGDHLVGLPPPLVSRQPHSTKPGPQPSRAPVGDCRVQRPGNILPLLQRQLGNRAVTGLVQRQAALGATHSAPLNGVKPPQGTETVVVVGSPQPREGYPSQFLYAALRDSYYPVRWLVERTGYEQAGVLLDTVREMAPGPPIQWVTPERPLVEHINALPARSIKRLVVHSHGVAGHVYLRYNWPGLADYGLTIAEAGKLSGVPFAQGAVIDLESCKGGQATVRTSGPDRPSVPSDSLAQAMANTTQRDVRAWTGRTSYADVNRGRGGVRGSRLGWTWDSLRELWARIESGPPRRRTFQPVQRNPVTGLWPPVQREAASSHGQEDLAEHIEWIDGLPAEIQRQIRGGRPGRVDFMGKMSAVLGGVEAVKQHFRAMSEFHIGGVKLWMHEGAGRRVVDAVDAYSAGSSGVPIPRPHNALSLRGRHRGKHGFGLMGHPLGISIDFDPRHNPHLHERRWIAATLGRGTTRVVLRRSDGRPYTRDEGVAIVARLGRAEGGEASSPEFAALLESAEDSFRAMADTAGEIRKLLSPEDLSHLRAVAEKYWTTKKVSNTELGEAVAAVVTQLQHSLDDLADAAHPDLATAPRRWDKLAKLVMDVRRANDRQLKRVFRHWQSLWTTEERSKLLALEMPLRRESMSRRIQYVTIKRFEEALLSDPLLAFGPGLQRKGRWLSAQSVGKDRGGVSLIQLLESGPVSMAPEFFVTMVRLGFYPGAAYSTVDTQHFDFAELFERLKGGRGGKFTPSGYMPTEQERRAARRRSPE